MPSRSDQEVRSTVPGLCSSSILFSFVSPNPEMLGLAVYSLFERG